MKLFRVPLMAIAAFCLFACQNQPPAPAEKKSFFPVRDYLQSEIENVDSFPVRMMEYNTRNGKTDSALITMPAFDKLATAFLLPDLDSAQFEERFEENSFMDQSTGLISFTYSTKDKHYGLRRVDVLATPDPVGTDKVKSIYLESSSAGSDSLVLTKMFWISGKSFTIIHIYQPTHGETGTSQTKVVWGSSD